MVATFVVTGYMFVNIPKGFFPIEDTGQISVTTEKNASAPSARATMSLALGARRLRIHVKERIEFAAGSCAGELIEFAVVGDRFGGTHESAPG